MRIRNGFMHEALTPLRESVMHVTSVNVATARPWCIDGRQVASAIGKRPASGRVELQQLGLAGDEQADSSVHGGLTKAVYAYPAEHHPFWRTVRAQAGAAEWDSHIPPGLLGENLTLAGLTEDRAWIGDRLHFPHCTLAVSEPRYPCFKFNAAMGFAHAAKLMVQSGWCGFYLAVIEPGSIEAGEAFTVEPGPREVRIDELFRATTSSRRAG
jgi:MOSC domain-containing protein YiiM